MLVGRCWLNAVRCCVKAARGCKAIYKEESYTWCLVLFSYQHLVREKKICREYENCEEETAGGWGGWEDGLMGGYCCRGGRCREDAGRCLMVKRAVWCHARQHGALPTEGVRLGRHAHRGCRRVLRTSPWLSACFTYVPSGLFSSEPAALGPVPFPLFASCFFFSFFS